MSNYEPYNWESLRPQPVIGVDEAGRGCLAGPVYAGAVIFKSEIGWNDITDSKLLSEARRETLFDLILQNHLVGVGSASVDEIAEFNILNAALLAMKRAVEALQVPCGHIIVDGTFKIKGLKGYDQTPLIKGDLRALPVAAASIVAKVSRDRYMRDLHQMYPHYGFEKHKGYSTALHKKTIQEHGPCPLHRKTFAGVREYWTVP